MSNRDIGIRALIPGQRSPDEIKEDQNTKRYVETIVNQSVQAPEVNPPGYTSDYIPSINISTPKSTEEARDKFGNTKAQKNKMINDQITRKPKPMKITNYIDKMNHLYSNEPKNDKTVQQLQTLKNWGLSKPVGLGDKYKSDLRTPVQKKRDAYTEKQKWINDDKKLKAFAKAEDPTKGAHYIPWQDRMAQEEAEHLNSIKRDTWKNGGSVGPEPKYVSAQDVQNVYKPKQTEASPLQVKKLHERLQNHNERTGEFKSTEEKPSHQPRFLHNPVTNELEDTYDPKWGDDILNDKK
jgi:hypothetical protein